VQKDKKWLDLILFFFIFAKNKVIKQRR